MSRKRTQIERIPYSPNGQKMCMMKVFDLPKKLKGIKNGPHLSTKRDVFLEGGKVTKEQTIPTPVS